MLKALSSLSLITSGNNAGGVTYSLASSYSNISSNLPFVSGTTYTVTPQILTDEAKMVLTSSKGHTYTLKLSDITVNGAKLTALEAGKSYQINVTVNDTAVTINVTCSDWTNINGTGDVTPDK